MHDWKSQSYVKWDCKYHIVFIPKYRQKVFYGKMRIRVGAIIRELCQYKGVELVEGRAMPDHIHLCLSIPPKYSVSHNEVSPISKYCVFFVLLVILLACSGLGQFVSQEQGPNEDELKESLSALLPDYVAIRDFNVEASQNVGDEVDPLYKVRFNAELRLTEDTFVPYKQVVMWLRQSLAYCYLHNFG